MAWMRSSCARRRSAFSLLAAARRVAAVDCRSAQLAELANHAHELLDDLDESLLSLDHARDRAVFAQFAELREGLAELEARRAAFLA
jgi:hypothetical protein